MSSLPLRTPLAVACVALLGLARRHRARIHATVAFKPDGGTARRSGVRLTLRKGPAG
jgi:hypothetical protein